LNRRLDIVPANDPFWLLVVTSFPLAYPLMLGTPLPEIIFHVIGDKVPPLANAGTDPVGKVRSASGGFVAGSAPT
jgi:hypothetical protein